MQGNKTVEKFQLLTQRIKPYDKLILVDSQKYPLQLQDKQKVTSILKHQIQYLLDKKQKQKQRKRKLKQLEQEYERKRKQKIQQIQHKTKKSINARQVVIKQKLQKNKKSLQHVDKVHQKANQERLQKMKQGFSKRKQFYSTDLQTKHTNNHSRINHQNIPYLNLSHDKQSKNIYIEDEMKKIQQKLSKAKNNYEDNRNQILKKLNEKQKHNLMIKQKIKSYSVMQQQRSYRQVYGKSQHIIEAEKKIKDLTEKHLENRRKSFQHKIQKLHQNIQSIESQQIQKYQSLEQKLNKRSQFNPFKRSNTDQNHRQRVILNNMKLEEEKKQKAEQIIKKHVQITAKNKIFKEKKDKILQTIKKPNPEENNT